MVRQIDLRELKGEGHLDNRLLELQKSSFNAKKSAVQVRSIIAVSPEEQFGWKKRDYTNALKIWRRKLESLGIWVFKASFKEDNYCGFYLPDNDFPIVYINNSMPHSRQIFTLFHELGHFLLSKGGIDFRNNMANELTGKHAQEEVFCNKFAEAFLVPDDSLDINHQNYNNETIQDLAFKYKVSREVILRKYLDKNIIGDKAYQDRVNQWKHESDKLKQQKNANKIYNKFTEAVLMLDDTPDINHKNYNNETIQDLAFKYKVSREVILRKYLDKDIIGNKAYQDTVKQWKCESDKQKQQKRANKISGGNYYATLATYLGNKYLELAILAILHEQNRRIPTGRLS